MCFGENPCCWVYLHFLQTMFHVLKFVHCMDHAFLVIFVMVLASRWNMVIPLMDCGFNMLWFQSHEMHACTTWWCSTSSCFPKCKAVGVTWLFTMMYPECWGKLQPGVSKLESAVQLVTARTSRTHVLPINVLTRVLTSWILALCPCASFQWGPQKS